ncbi:YeeE/YedE thiosulfate transporter family protein [Staphylococcus aureus]
MHIVFQYWATIIGSFIFGIGIVLAGGCAQVLGIALVKG